MTERRLTRKGTPAADRGLDYVARPEPLRGYRELTPAERELVDDIKHAEQEVGRLWARAKQTLGTDERMVTHSRTVLQDGFMWLVRSVTRPRDVYEAALSTLDGPEGPSGKTTVDGQQRRNP